MSQDRAERPTVDPDAAPTDRPSEEHTRPEGISDATVEALGKVSEALEAIEVARGHLYTFHRLSGTADLTLGEGVALLRKAGHEEVADRIERELVGRNVLEGRWTFQIMEEYDDTYYSCFKEMEKYARDELIGGRRHVYEAEMKERERTRGHARHLARPADDGPQGAGSDT